MIDVNALHQKFSEACKTAMTKCGYAVEVVGVGSTSRGTHDPTAAMDFDFNVQNRTLFQRLKDDGAFLRRCESELASTIRAKISRPCELNTKDKQLAVAALQGRQYSDNDAGRFTFKFSPDVDRSVNIDFSVGASQFFHARGMGYALWFSQQKEELVADFRATVAELKPLRGAGCPLKAGIGVESLAWQCGVPFEDFTILEGEPYFIRHTAPSLNLVSRTIKRIVGSPDELGDEHIPSNIWHICFLIDRVRIFHDVLNCKSRAAWRNLNSQIDALQQRK